MRSFCLMLIIMVFSSVTTAGSFRTDSLEKLLPLAKTEVSRAEILSALCMEYGNIDADKAIDYGNEVIELASKLQQKKILGDAYIFLGLAYNIKGDIDNARLNYFKCYKIRNGLNDVSGIAAVLNNIGLLYYRESDFDNAVSYLEKSAKYAKKSNNVTVLKAVCKNLSEIYNKLHDFRSAWEYDRIYANIQDSLLNSEKKKRITELEALYENEKKQHKIDDLENQRKIYDNEIKKQRQIFIVVLIFLVIVLLLFLLLYRGYRNKQKTNKLLKEQYAVIADQKEELEKLSIVAEKSQAGIMICNANGEIVWVNRGFENLTGYTIEEFIKEYGSDLKSISTNKEIEKELRLMEEEQKAIRYESYHYTKNGEFVWTSVTHTPVFEFKDKMTRIISVYNDITELKIAEEALKSKNKDINDSLEYASTLQQSMLPDEKIFSDCFTDYFIINKPKDIVSGDFYWIYLKNNTYYVAVADCTGHGVPGAFVSLIGINLLNSIMKRKPAESPGDILTILNKEVIKVFKENEPGNISDGMDITLISYRPGDTFLNFAGAINTLVLIRNGSCHDYVGNRKSIGGRTKLAHDFQTKKIELIPGDNIYMFSDGYADQFGGEKGRKLLLKTFKEHLAYINSMNMGDQKDYLLKQFDLWKGDENQVDDVMVLGIRI